MAATVATTVGATEVAATNISFTLTITTGQTVVVCLTSRDNAGANYSSSTWNAVNKPADETFNGTLANGLQSHILIFRSITGTAQVLNVVLDSSMDGLAGWAVIVDGANQTTTIGPSGANLEQGDGSGSSTATSLGALTSASGDLALAFHRARADVTASLTPNGGQTILSGPTLTAVVSNTIEISSKAAGAGTTSVGWTFASGNTWLTNGVIIQGTGGGGGGSGLLVDGCLTNGLLLGSLA